MKNIVLLIKHYHHHNDDSFFAQYNAVLATVGEKVGKKGRKYRIPYKGKIYRVVVKKYNIIIKEEVM